MELREITNDDLQKIRLRCPRGHFKLVSGCVTDKEGKKSYSLLCLRCYVSIPMNDNMRERILQELENFRRAAELDAQQQTPAAPVLGASGE